MKNIAIIGAGGHGKVAALIASEQGWHVSFFDDAYPRFIKCGHWNVVGDLASLIVSENEYDVVFVAIGDNYIREKIQVTLSEAGFDIATLVSAQATVSQFVTIGKGVLVVANACLNIGCSINDGAIINTGANIDHDCVIGAYSHVSPGVNLAGGVQIGERTWIGIGTSVIQNRKIKENVIIGAGSVVINDIEKGVIAFGCPARIKNKC